MNRLFNTAVLHLVGVITGLALGLWEFLKILVPSLFLMTLLLLVLWLTFNFGVGSKATPDISTKEC